MKVADLQGALLDYWVARANGLRAKIRHGSCYEGANADAIDWADGWVPGYRPSSDWRIAGATIEREGISLNCHEDGSWHALNVKNNAMAVGPAPLIAAMRAYVLSKFGDAVPDELT